MALKLKPPVALWKNMRELANWCRETLLEGSVGTDNIQDGSVTLPKLADLAADKLIGSISAGPPVAIACTAAGRALLDDAAASDQRTTLGLGTAATQNTGTNGSVVPLLNAANEHGSGRFALFAVGAATPSATQAANADTSGATLGQLETEVNELKSLLRTFGLLGT